MPDSKTTNRERLLRLIDGGHEALKEFEQPESAKKEPAAPKAVVPKPSAPPVDIALLVKWALALVAVVALLHYGARIIEAVKPGPQTAPSASAAPSPRGDEGLGLRLVGVDSSAPPVALLEDLATGKTHFARLGDRVLGIRVTAIEKNKVTVSFKGRTLELR